MHSPIFGIGLLRKYLFEAIQNDFRSNNALALKIIPISNFRWLKSENHKKFEETCKGEVCFIRRIFTNGLRMGLLFYKLE